MTSYRWAFLPLLLTPSAGAAQPDTTTRSAAIASRCAPMPADTGRRDTTVLGAPTPPTGAAAAVGADTPTPQPVAMALWCVEESETGLGRSLHVQVTNLRDAIIKDKRDPAKFVLYLNGRPLWNVHGTLVDPQTNTLEFLVARADTSRETWTLLLGKPTAFRKPNIRVGVGYGDAQLDVARGAPPPVVTLIVMGGWRLTFGLLILGVLLVSFWQLAWQSNIIRDSVPPKPPPDARKPYSLGRLQMAVWFFLILAAFVFLWMITGSAETLNAQSLMLMGIGTGTALGAAAVDLGKRTTAENSLASLVPQRAKLAEEVEQLTKQVQAAAAAQPPADPAAKSLLAVALAEKTALVSPLDAQIADAKAMESEPVSQNLWKDILTDANGISFHRFQMLAWTIVLGFVFIVGVYEGLAMPEFNATLLALMGIASGTYLGFKIPERQS